MILAWTGLELSRRQASDWHTDGQTDSGNDNTRWPYWPRVKTTGSINLIPTFILMGYISWSWYIFMFLALILAFLWPNIWPFMGFLSKCKNQIILYMAFNLWGYVSWPLFICSCVVRNIFPRKGISKLFYPMTLQWQSNVCIFLESFALV